MLRKRNRQRELPGFAPLWGKPGKRGWIIQRNTAKDRVARVLKRAAQWCKSQRHMPVRLKHRALCPRLTGHNPYYGITGNYVRCVEELDASMAHVRICGAWRAGNCSRLPDEEPSGGSKINRCSAATIRPDIVFKRIMVQLARAWKGQALLFLLSLIHYPCDAEGLKVPTWSPVRRTKPVIAARPV